MGARAQQPAVTVRSTGPETTAEVDEDRMLYRQVQQIPNPKSFEVEWPKLTPRKMAEWLKAADADQEFRQRVVTDADLKRWTTIVRSDRFVHYLPNGPLCFDPDGHLLNGKHRLTAGVACGKSLGFMVVRNVPRWMHRYFDSPKKLTLNDILTREGRASTKGLTSGILHLALRYEEFLHGMRPGIGWRKWGGVRDEHTDLESLLLRREDLMDLLPAASQAHRGKGAPGCRLLVPALVVFRFYQELAWPAGSDVVQEFWDGLATGAMLPMGSPVKTLREWGFNSYEERERWPGKRETHLLLLWLAFAAFAAGGKMHRVQWAYGFPMPAPYHPDGAQVAVKNVLSALEVLDENDKITE